MRIVIATPFYPPHSGVLAIYALGLKEAFEERGDIVTIVSFDSVRSLPPGLRHLLYFMRMLSAARSASFVLALDTWSVGLPAVIAARLTGTTFAVRIGGDFLWEAYVARTKESVRLSEFYIPGRALSWKERFIFRGTQFLITHACALIFTTRFQKNIWSASYRIDEKRVSIVENHFPASIGTYLPARGPILVAAGRGIALKNMEMLERVVARLQDTHPGLELDSRLLPPEEHRNRIGTAQAVVIPSISEVCSNTAIDAVSMGKPFICTEDTGTSEHLKDCGLFIDTRSEAALEQAIETMLDPVSYEKLAGNARAFSFTHSWDDIASEIIEHAGVER